MSIVTRQPISDPRGKLTEYVEMEGQIVDHKGTFPQALTDLQGHYSIDVNGQQYQLTEQTINQWLGIGNFSVTGFRDNARVIVGDINGVPVNAQVYQLNSVKNYASAQEYMFRMYQDKAIATVNKDYPSMDVMLINQMLFDYLTDLGLHAQVYELSYDPITGKQVFEVVVKEWQQSVDSIPLNKDFMTGARITNSNTGHEHFRFRVHSIQKVCGNGMIAKVKRGGLELIHRSVYDIVSKIRNFIYTMTGRRTSHYEFTRGLYEDFTEALFLSMKKHSNVITQAYERASTTALPVSTVEYMEKALPKWKKAYKLTNTDIAGIVTTFKMDTTISKAEDLLSNVVMATNRYANSVTGVKRESLQELAYEVALAPVIRV